jgi:hypothetical protein
VSGLQSERGFPVLNDLAWHVHPDQRVHIINQLRRLDHVLAEQNFDQTETARLRQLSARVLTVL